MTTVLVRLPYLLTELVSLEPTNCVVDTVCTVSLVFDQGDENKFAYTDVHKEYNALVSIM